MSIFDVTEANILKLYFNGTAIANIADNAAASPLASIWLSLHTADPTDAGTEGSSESAYAGYARTSTNRATGAGGWTVSGNSPTQAALSSLTSFPAATASATAIGFFAAGKASSGATDGFWSGAVSPAITPANGVTPQLTASTVCTLD